MSRLGHAKAMVAAYNAQDVDAYVALMTDDACEAAYRGAVIRDGASGTRDGLAAMFAQFPENHAEVVSGWEFAEHAVLLERVRRTPDAEPFDVMAIYSFEGDLCSRVEFVR